ncbi:hypothetical protein [Sanguibacter suaedae]|uniref:Uncharacterized protein n=1 Tax=Sanguibacter suaedae TaxID=2795737 RepID=A0A934I5S0_9MICO|nr:hypothetical protein [Sanguibacter suaedae]MBI9113702.1 hypothetical protein [Sanguibacter suaedae]
MRLHELELTRLRGDVDLPSTGMEEIERITLHGARSLKISSLSGHLSLRAVTLASIGSLRAGTTFVDAPLLRRVHLEDISQIDTVAWVREEAELNQLLIVGTAPWIRAARQQVGKLPGGWSFPPWVDQPEVTAAAPP